MSGIHLSAVPHWMTDFAQLMFGLVLWARDGARLLCPLQAVHTFRVVELAFIVIASVAAAASSPGLSTCLIATMILATSPGGLAEMTITAQALHISVPLVVAFHVFRVVVVNMGTQYIYAGAARWLREDGPLTRHRNLHAVVSLTPGWRLD